MQEVLEERRSSLGRGLHSAKQKSATIACVRYVRMSSDQQGASPEQQRQACEELEAREGYSCVREYFDSGISGVEARKRPDFLQMMRDAERLADFEVITCWDQDRFGRFDSLDAGEWTAPLRRLGIALHTVAQGKIDWKDFSGRVIYTVQQEGKHQYVVDLSRVVWRGKAAGARKGNFQGSAPYGYDRAFLDSSGNVVHREPRGSGFARPHGWAPRLVPNAEEAEIVRRIFDEFVNADRSIAGITRDLNSRAVPGPRAPQWFRNTVRRLLANRIYVGDTAYGKKAAGKFHFTADGGEMARREDNRPTVVRERRLGAFLVSGTHEALIDLATWDRAQARIDAQRTESTRPRDGGYMLAGLVRCGHCGRRMVASKTRLRDGRQIGYYRCEADLRVGGRSWRRGFHAATGTCTCRCAPRDFVEKAVIDFVEREILSPEAVLRIEQERAALVERASSEQQTRSLSRQISELDLMIQRGAENLLLAGNPACLAEASSKLSDWKERREKMARQLRALEAQAARRKEAPAGRDTRERLEAALRSDNCRAIRTALKTVLSEVRVFWKPFGKPKPGGRFRKYRVDRVEPVVILENV